MSNFVTADEALRAIDREAAEDALEWLRNEKPKTIDAIEYLVFSEKWSLVQIVDYVEKRYSDTEPKAQHKMMLVAEAMVKQREEN